jgi:tetratricopeptide (TPR) repeat protein
MNDVFLYLNKYDPSKIRPIVDPIVAEMKNDALSDAQLDGKIREAMEKSKYPLIPLEYAEIKLHCAVAKYSRRKYIESKILMDEAFPKYENDPHRRAVILWLMGINALSMEDASFAHSYWMSSRIIFEEIIKGKHFQITRPDVSSWYLERLKEINHLMAANCIQEIFTWFGLHESNHMDGQTVAFSEKIFEAIGSRKYHEAYQLIETLIRLVEMSNDHEEIRDVYVLCGVAKYMLGATSESIKYFSEAISKLEPKSHRQSVTYWLKGTAQWRIPAQREEAITNLNRSIDLFKDLRLKADKKHLAQVMQWYDDKLGIMEKEARKKEKILISI